MICVDCGEAELEERDWFRGYNFKDVEIVCKSFFCPSCNLYFMTREQKNIYRNVMFDMVRDCEEQNKYMKPMEFKKDDME